MRAQLPLSLLLNLLLLLGAGSTSNISAKHPSFRPSTPVLSLETPDEWRAAITGPRNYTLVALFTATAKAHQCRVCLEFQPTFWGLARASFNNYQNKDGVVFMRSDLNARSRFLWESLEIAVAPVLLVLPATSIENDAVGKFREATGKTKWHKLLYSGQDASEVMEWIQQYSQFAVPLDRPAIRTASWADALRSYATLGLGTVTIASLLLYARRSVVVSRAIWTAALMGFIALMCSGFMWVRIRHAGLILKNGGAIMPQLQAQVGMEAIIVFVLYYVCSMAVIATADWAGRIPNKWARKAASLGALLAFVLAYSEIFIIIRKKMPQYPLSFLWTN